MSSTSPEHRRQWRFYKTEKGSSPVRRFLDELTDDDAAAIVAEMKAVQTEGLRAARHLDGEIYEVRASGKEALSGKKKAGRLAGASQEKRASLTPYHICHIIFDMRGGA